MAEPSGAGIGPLARSRDVDRDVAEPTNVHDRVEVRRGELRLDVGDRDAEPRVRLLERVVEAPTRPRWPPRRRGRTRGTSTPRAAGRSRSPPTIGTSGPAASRSVPTIDVRRAEIFGRSSSTHAWSNAPARNRKHRNRSFEPICSVTNATSRLPSTAIACASCVPSAYGQRGLARSIVLVRSPGHASLTSRRSGRPPARAGRSARRSRCACRRSAGSSPRASRRARGTPSRAPAPRSMEPPRWIRTRSRTWRR